MIKNKIKLKVSLLNRISIYVAQAIKRNSLRSQMVFNKVLTSKNSGHIGMRLSVIRAALQFKKAFRDVPAYREVLSNADITISKNSLENQIKNLPETDKKNYIDIYSTAERCVGGKIPLRDAEIDESSGSSGKPYNWIRGHKELVEMRKTLSRLAMFLYGPDTVTINGFSMGAWATGTNVSMSLVRNGLIKSTGPDAEKMLSVFEMLGKDRTYIVTGYPPFLLELLEYGKKQNFPWHEYTMIGIVGGEAMSETLRSRLLEYFKIINSAYGASDLDIGVACEFPLSVWIRQEAAKNPELAQALFGDARRLPMLFQYDPLDYYVERNDAGELIVTVNRPSALSPRLRYNVHDIGGKLDFDYVIDTCKKFNLDPIAQAPLPYAGKHPQLPFLFIGGRSDSTISYLGANIYPEDVEQALFGDAPKSENDVIKGFAMELVENVDGHPHPVVHIELAENHKKEEISETMLSERIVTRLAKNSRDFKTSLVEDPRAKNIEVKIHNSNTGPFENMSDRIKRRYILTK